MWNSFSGHFPCCDKLHEVQVVFQARNMASDKHTNPYWRFTLVRIRSLHHIRLCAIWIRLCNENIGCFQIQEVYIGLPIPPAASLKNVPCCLSCLKWTGNHRPNRAKPYLRNYRFQPIAVSGDIWVWYRTLVSLWVMNMHVIIFSNKSQ